MADGIGQMLDGLLAFVVEFAGPIALAIGAYWAWVLVRRFRSNTDPSVRKSTTSGIGSMSMLLSGAYLSVVVAGTIAAVLYLAGSLTPAFAGVLAGGVVGHALLEKREDRGGEPVLAGDDDD